mmetsp:Transcript_14557/g.43004  ORF Transcript_14557/g.43004 Transcript_14557/m.43004 type:complete len:255 (-) Transcript_14557:270-1034(-)
MPPRKTKRKVTSEEDQQGDATTGETVTFPAQKRSKVTLDDFEIEEMTEPEEEEFVEHSQQTAVDTELGVEDVPERRLSYRSSAEAAAPPPNLVVMDRRISLTKVATEAHTLYSLVRAWVSDDPQRQVQGAERPADAGLFLPRPDPPMPQSLEKLERAPMHVPKEQLLNSLYSVPSTVLLQHHLARMRLVRKWALRQRAYRYRRFQRRLQVLGVTFSDSENDTAGHHDAAASSPGLVLPTTSAASASEKKEGNGS